MRANIRGRYRCVKSSAPGTQPPTELHRGNDANGMIRQKKFGFAAIIMIVNFFMIDGQ